jgi:hypothetical protein
MNGCEELRRFNWMRCFDFDGQNGFQEESVYPHMPNISVPTYVHVRLHMLIVHTNIWARYYKRHKLAMKPFLQRNSALQIFVTYTHILNTYLFNFLHIFPVGQLFYGRIGPLSDLNPRYHPTKDTRCLQVVQMFNKLKKRNEIDHGR